MLRRSLSYLSFFTIKCGGNLDIIRDTEDRKKYLRFSSFCLSSFSITYINIKRKKYKKEGKILSTEIAIIDDGSLLFSQGLNKLFQILNYNHFVLPISDLRFLDDVKADILIFDFDHNRELILSYIKSLNKPYEILLFTQSIDHDTLTSVIKMGVNGILTKDIGISQLEESISSLLRGKAYIHPKLTDSLVTSYRKHLFSKPKQKTDDITIREKEIITFIGRGYTDKEIADQLNISYKTVRNHIYNIQKKTNVRNRVQLVVLALRRRWIDVNECIG